MTQGREMRCVMDSHAEPVQHWGVVQYTDIGYPSETHIKLKSRENSFAHNIRFSCSIVLKLCTEHGSVTAVLYVKFQNDWITNK